MQSPDPMPEPRYQPPPPSRPPLQSSVDRHGGPPADPFAPAAGWARPPASGPLEFPLPGTSPYGVPPTPPPGGGTRGLAPWGMPARHSWEIPLLVIVVLCTALAYLMALGLFLVALAEGITPGDYLLLLVFAPVLVWAGRGLNFATQRVSGVKMSPTQFPEGYRMVAEAAQRFGMRTVPDAYVVLGNGQINAFASGHGFRRFVVVYSDLFEVGGQAREPDALAFIIGHEVGHIAAGHVSYWRQLGMFLVPFLPILGSSLSRSQEYTADNYGYCHRATGAPAAMGTLAAGKYLNTLVGFDEMADRAATERGGFVWLVNALASHPVLTWRMSALRDRSGHGKLFWRPSPRPAGYGAPPYSAPPYGEAPALPPKPVA